MHYYKITYELDNGINKKTETIKIMAHDVLQAINSLNENSLLISNLSIVEIDKKEFEKDIITTMRVEFDVDIKKEFVDEFSRIIDHHIEYMIDLSEFPEIKGIGNAKLYCKESENESTINIDDYYIISQEKVGFENGTEKHFIEYLDKNNKWTKVKENALKHVSLSSATTNYVPFRKTRSIGEIFPLRYWPSTITRNTFATPVILPVSPSPQRALSSGTGWVAANPAT